MPMTNTSITYEDSYDILFTVTQHLYIAWEYLLFIIIIKLHCHYVGELNATNEGGLQSPRPFCNLQKQNKYFLGTHE